MEWGMCLHCFLWWLPLDSLKWKLMIKEVHWCSHVAPEWWAGRAFWGTELGWGRGKRWAVHLMGQMEDAKSHSHCLLNTALWFLDSVHCVIKVPVRVYLTLALSELVTILSSSSLIFRTDNIKLTLCHLQSASFLSFTIITQIYFLTKHQQVLSTLAWWIQNYFKKKQWIIM